MSGDQKKRRTAFYTEALPDLIERREDGLTLAEIAEAMNDRRQFQHDANVGTPCKSHGFMKAILRSASSHKITSEDGQSLVVPFAVTVTPTLTAGVEKLDTIDCYQTCWFILGAPVLCVSRCTTIHPAVAPERTPPDDRTLMGLVTPGPPLQNPELVEQGLAELLPQAGTPMEAGIILMYSVLSSLSEQPTW